MKKKISQRTTTDYIGECFVGHFIQHAAAPAIDALIARFLSTDSNDEISSALGTFKDLTVNQHSTVTHYQRPNMTHPQEGGTGGEVSEILFFSAKSKRRPSLIYSMQIIPVCLSIVARRKGVSPTRRGGLNWTPISLLVGRPCKLFHSEGCYQTIWCEGGWTATSTCLPTFRRDESSARQRSAGSH